jgi:hypothetical protein
LEVHFEDPYHRLHSTADKSFEIGYWASGDNNGDEYAQVNITMPEYMNGISLDIIIWTR